eukprot:FR744242.1.p1 GENE.FR744242.1~~FR744242.1.p1  ORF type:complete len:320 (+),score=59.14 FR744242.1:102-962(+)
MMQSVEVLKPGDTIIQADPCSLVGQAVIQLAKVLSITTINLLPSDGEDFEAESTLLRELGVDFILPSSAEAAVAINALPTAAPRLGLVTSDVGAATSMIQVLREECSLCVYGDVGGDLAKLRLPVQRLMDGVKITGFSPTKWTMDNRPKVQEIVDMLMILFESEKLSVTQEAWDAFPRSFDAALERSKNQNTRVAQVLLNFSTLKAAQEECMQHAAVEEQTDALTGWLESIGMEKYVNTFLEAGYELENILEVGLTDEEMDFLQIKLPMHRPKIIQLNTKGDKAGG